MVIWGCTPFESFEGFLKWGAPKASILMVFFFQIIINQPFWDPKMTPHLWKPPFADTSVLDLLWPISGPKTSAAPASSKLLTHYKTM